MISFALTLPLLAGSFAPEAAAPAPALTPHEAVLSQVRALRNDDVGALIRSFVTDAQFAEMRAAWEEERRRTPDPTESAEFTAFITQFAAKDAEKELWPDVEAALDEMRPQVGMMVAMFSAMAEGAIEQEASLSNDDRKQAQELVQTLSEKLTERDLTDPKLARKALGVVCETVRSLEVQNLDDVYELTFDQLLDRAGLMLRGTKELMTIYGFEINGWLSSFSAETLHSDGDYAVVRVKYSILGLSESSEVEMTRIAGRWFQKETADQAALLGR